MSLRIRIFIVAVLAVVLASLRGLVPPPASVSGAFGRGSTIVLVHGLGSRAQHWLPVARLLARRHRVVLVDLPGHGQSEMPEPFSLERARVSLDEALAREGRDPVVLVGHSLGGLVAAAEACSRPDRVRALVLVETALRPQVEGKERTAVLEALDRDYQGTLRAEYESYGRDSTQGRALYREVAQLDPAMVRQWVRVALTADLSQRATSLMPPLLVVLAPRSWPHGEPWSATADALGYVGVPHVEPLRLEDCGHFVMLDRPADLARAIERFAAAPEGAPLALR